MTSDEKDRDFDRTIGLNLLLLRSSGVVSWEEGLLGRNVLACVAFACMTIYSVLYTYEFATSSTDLTTVLESIAMIIPIVGGQTRFAILLWLRVTCQRMLHVCESFWSTLKPEEKKIVESYASKARHLTRCYLASCVLTILFYAVYAFFDSSIFVRSKDFERATRNGSGSGSGNVSDYDDSILAAGNERRLPYAFFLEIEKTPWYQIVYVLQLVVMLNVAITCIAVDTTGPLFILIACGYFETIRIRIENFHSHDRASSPPATTSNTASYTSRIKRSSSVDLRICVTHHSFLLEFCRDIEHLVNAVFLIQLITSTYNISLVGFKLAEDNPGKFKYITQLVIAIIQLLLCNWPADLLLSKSEAISHAAYLMPWYRYPYRLRKPTNMIMVRGQKPVRLTAGKFIGLSLETFASMISTAASFFTMVRSMN